MRPSFSQNTNRHSRFDLGTLLETARMLAESHDMDFVVNNLLLISMGKLMVTRAMVLIYHPTSGTYEVARCKGKNCPPEGQYLSLNLEDEVRQQSVIKCENTHFELPAVLDSNSHCTLFNLRTSNNHIGFLFLGSKGNRQPLSAYEVEFIEGLSIISAVAIANSRMFTEMRHINRMLDRKVYELNTLFELSKDFNIMVDRHEIVRIFKFAMLGQMLIRKFFFVLDHEGKRQLLASSGIARKPSADEIDRLFELKNDLTVLDQEIAEKQPFLQENDIQAVLSLYFQNEKKAVVGFGPRANGKEFSSSDFKFLRSLGNLALLSIQKTYLLEERIEKERMEEELGIAKNIQKGLLPDPIPEHEGLDIAAENLSSYQVGGDYFDIIKTTDRNLLFAIADVTGKGMPAALLMANLQAMLHVLLPTDMLLAEASGKINDIIHQNTPADKFITFFWGTLNADKRTFRYVNAGHNPPLLLRADAQQPQELAEGGLILGAMPTMTAYQEQEVSLGSGDLLILYTDGVTEAMNASGTEEFGEDRLIKVLLEHRKLPAKEIKQVIIQSVKQFAGPVQSDDLTLVIVKIR